MKNSIILLLLIITACNSSGIKKSHVEVEIIEAYEPKDSITFPHEIHYENQIDCKYCHNPKTGSNKQELTTNICTNCHKKVNDK